MCYLSNVKPYHFDELIKNNLSLDHIFVLEMMENDLDVEYFFKDSERGQAMIQTLVRTGHIKEGIILGPGKALLEFMRKSPEKPLKIKRRATMAESDMDRIWNAYPATDNIVRDGKILFSGTRALRKAKGGKDAVRSTVSKILDEGKYTVDDIVRSINFEVRQKIEESIKRRENKLSWMQNIDTYFNQRTFEPYVEVSKLASTEARQPTKFVTDI